MQQMLDEHVSIRQSPLTSSKSGILSSTLPVLMEYLLRGRHTSRVGVQQGARQAEILSTWHLHPRENHSATATGLRVETLEAPGFKFWL